MLLTRMKLGLYGGSFDPVHCGHLLAAQAACEELELSRLFFIPAAQSPFKPESNLAPAALRLRMLRLGLAGQSHYEIDEQEITRGGVSYTINTIRDYTRRFPQADLFYLIGADHLPQLPKWRETEELAKRVEFAVIPRPGETPIASPPMFRLRLLKGFPLGISSSQLRARVKAGLSIHGLAPSAVAEVIRNEKLYQ